MTDTPAPQDFANRRRQVAQRIGADGIAVIAAAPERVRNRDVFHPYRQDSDFLYLTGVSESDMVLVIAPGSDHGDTLLFCREAEAREALYDGMRITPDEAPTRLGVDAGFDLEDLDLVLPQLLAGRDCLHYPIGSELDRHIPDWTARRRAGANFGAPIAGRIADLGALLHEMRLRKDAAEIERMRAAARINAEGHRRAMATAAPGVTELRLEAELRYAWTCAGARECAYPPIVAAGANACVMHYHGGAGTLADGDLVLIDAGPEFDGYASDVTRTFPVNGRFTAEQRALYEVVLAAQRAAIAAARPGQDFDAPQRAAGEQLVDGLIALGVLEGDPVELLRKQAHMPWAIHRVSHWLGLDVHDVGDYSDGSNFRQLEPGMVLTIEPGLYFPASPDAPPGLCGTGIRIEDDILITADGNEVLSAAIPTAPDAIEQWVQGHE